MKRACELELVIEEIVSTGKAKNEKGELLHPVMMEPLVLTFFGAPEALYEVITERPIMLLNLLQTNKALDAFFGRFEGMWIRMIDALIENEMGTYAKEVYPFIVVEQHYTDEDDRVGSSFIGEKKKEEKVREFRIQYLSWRSPQSPVSEFEIVYFDTMTRLYIELLGVMKYFLLPPAISRRMLLLAYIGQAFKQDHFVAEFDDCLLYAEMKDTPMFIENYSNEMMRRGIEFIANHLVEEEVSALPSSHRIEQFAVARKLITKLTTLLDEGVEIEPPQPVKLDKSVATPYRTLLFDSQQGLCKTPEAQKELLFEVLRQLSESDEAKGEIIEKYGCTICQALTHAVDPLLMRAFCTERCRSQYLGHSLK